ncbi:hypothetical protein Tsubulata_028402 [Turnera subulata]|uniref:Protein SIEL n=1 Tax=Turnera subulata TaxID=218843 RepID=A0A9Q0J5U5_9ROSI|nr:hypothetical protein Tsubulata_028402 [Turnera subulata]
MEQHLLGACENSLVAVNNDSKLLRLQTLASIRSLIINPHTSDSTLSSLLETLTRSLQLPTADPLASHHSLKLLADLASRRPHLAPIILDSVRSANLLSADSPRLAVDALSALASISESDRNSPRIELDDQLFVSLCFGPSVTARLWLLRNAERLGLQSHVLFTVFLGFTKDPYPYVREAALDGLAGLCRNGVVLEDVGAIEGCFCRALELLQDSEDSVRCAAVRVVSEWGRMLVAANNEEDKRAWSDLVFIQLCSMVRDMNAGVRVEAFNALGKVQMLSEDVLLQSLSKKVLKIVKEKESVHRYPTERIKTFTSIAAGAFVHGLEDEFQEVRKSACHSLRMLVVLSTEFAGHALDLLMDMLNDDSMAVRLEAMETMHHMATFECLKVQETHMHMFLGTLLDNSALIRSTARKIFKLVKLPTLGLFRLSINGLLENLEMHPQDEAEVFLILFYMGQNHGKFASRIIKEVSQEVEPVCGEELVLDSARVAAFLVLSISAPLSRELGGQRIAHRFFSYAVTLLGRISSALRDIVDQNTLLVYLTQCSRSSNSFPMEVEGGALSLPVVDCVPGHTNLDVSTMSGIEMQQTGNGTSEEWSLTSCKLGDVAFVGEQLEEREKPMRVVNCILAKMKYLWQLVQSRCANQALKILRACKEEIAMVASESPEFGSAVAFTLQYIRVMKPFIRIWEHVVSKVQSYKVLQLEILFAKLDGRLREMRCRFVGFSKELEVHVLELVLVTSILKLSKLEICCYRDTICQLCDTISCLDSLQKDGSIELSIFVVEVKKTLPEVDTSMDFGCCSPLFKLVDLFTPKQINLSRRIRHISAEVEVLDNDAERPFVFVTGLPVSIPLGIMLRNVTTNNRLWVRITMSEDLTEYVFLDLVRLEVFDEVKKFKFVAPFYQTPKAVSVMLRVSIGMLRQQFANCSLHLSSSVIAFLCYPDLLGQTVERLFVWICASAYQSPSVGRIRSFRVRY